MKRMILIALVAMSPLALCIPVVQAEPGPNATKDASQITESGPAVVAGIGATAGPNYKNQAIVPMPGMRWEEPSERPPTSTIRVPDVGPIIGPPAETPRSSGWSISSR